MLLASLWNGRAARSQAEHRHLKRLGMNRGVCWHQRGAEIIFTLSPEGRSLVSQSRSRLARAGVRLDCTKEVK